MRASAGALLALAATAGLLTACSSGTSAGTVGQVADWWNGGGEDRTTALTNDLGKISNDGTDITTMNHDCRTLSTDISAALSYQPIPDAQAQQHWFAALDKYQQAATDCQAGTSTMSIDLITKAGNEISDGTTELTAATTRILQIDAGS